MSAGAIGFDDSGGNDSDEDDGGDAMAALLRVRTRMV
eukprot:COSAG02_NODE_20660_length_820_cov_2.338419_1_plen_36_part_01